MPSKFRLTWLIVLLSALLAGCSSATPQTTPPPAGQATGTAGAPTAGIASPEEPTFAPTDASTEAAPTPPATATPATVAPTPVAAPVAGFTDGLLLATHEAALVIYYPGDGRTVTLLEPGLYDAGGDNFLISIAFPPRFSPDGQRLIVATPDEGTWLVGLDGSARPFHPDPVFATWSPDGQRVAFTGAIGPATAASDGDVYVADPAGDAPAEPLARLPGRAHGALWSPGCEADPVQEGACSQFIAVAASDNEQSVLWLIDAETGETRELGRFRPPPMGGVLWHRWTAGGDAIIAQADRGLLDFPLAGGGPRPLVVEADPAAAMAGEPSPDGTLYARLERDRDGRASLIVGSAATGQEVTVAPDFSQGERVAWSGDGRYALVENYGCYSAPCRYEVWAVDAGDFPRLGEAILLAEAGAFLGPLSALLERSTEVERRPWAAVESLPAAGPPDTWPRHALPEAGLSFAAPAGWRVQLAGDAFTIANYETRAGGLVALPDELIRIDGRWSGDFGNSLDYGDLDMIQEMHFNWEVTPVEVAGRPAVILSDRVAPVCDHVLLPHAGGELEITYCPATETWRALALDFLARLELES